MTKRQGRELKPRVCHHCGATCDLSKPTAWLWDVHAVYGDRMHGTAVDMIDTCSPACRVKMGLKERRV